ncbi:MAG: DJ-1 family glyoxalase III [Bacilli bacterium]|nr:DJ-1 family glyoxalase III [Bacilli bacterium]MDY6430914.1 DJ-1 family glyoxalase III [Bacilli bacterium]
MKKALILLANGFEESEALVTHDLLLRSKQMEVKLVSITSDKIVTASSGLAVVANELLNEIKDIDLYDFLVLPGGMPGVKNLFESLLVREIIKRFKEKGKHIHAICAAPSILNAMGYLKDYSYTCFPSFQGKDGAYKIEKGVVLDKDTVTAKAMGYSIDFGLTIVEFELGKEAREIVEKSILGK